MFRVGQLYKRRDIHHQIGGQWQGGISTPSDEPVILLFTGETGEQYGYRDGWTTEGTFSYSGEGQSGDMSFGRGNRAIRDHAADGKDIHLFQNVGRGNVRYLGPMICAGFHFVEGQLDAHGAPRRVIQFHLLPVAALSNLDVQSLPEGSRQLSLNEAHAQFNVTDTSSKEAKNQVISTTKLLRHLVLMRANGVCESCSSPAPFVDVDGVPFLEIHHVWRESDGGPDEPERVIALCPNCHRRAHYSGDKKTFNEGLKSKLADMKK